MNGRILNKATRDRGNNFLASVSDLMSGLLFIFILTLALFIIYAKEAKENADKKEAEAVTKTLLLNKAEEELQQKTKKVEKQEEELKKLKELALNIDKANEELKLKTEKVKKQEEELRKLKELALNIDKANEELKLKTEKVKKQEEELKKLKELALDIDKANEELKLKSEIVKSQEEELEQSRRQLQELAAKISLAREEAAKTGRLLSDYQEKLTGINKARNALLLNIAQKLQNEYNIAVAVDATGGILRLPEESVTFESGSELLNDKNRDKVKKFGSVLEQELPCFGVGNETNADCREINPQGYTLDAVFIEGHTDNMPFKNEPGNSGAGNRKLSTSRSNTVYDIMVNGSPILKSMVNPKEERLFSISGYGEERPLPGHAHKSQTDDAANRRIEMRFILTSPDLNESERAMLDSLKRGASDL
jgi:myosin heavy subunit